jgi:hypothetical protein
MDKKNLNKELVSLVLKKNELNRLDYNDPEYDSVEEELHVMEDHFVEKYGKYLEDVLKSVHDEFCPDNEVLLPIAYLANKYKINMPENGDAEFDVSLDEGVIVDVDNYADKLTRLVLVPNPTRLLLQIHNSHHEEVWKLEEVS